MIGKVEPSSCNYSETQGGRVNPFCYADEQEIIYVNYNLLKNERVWYSGGMKTILESITW